MTTLTKVKQFKNTVNKCEFSEVLNMLPEEGPAANPTFGSLLRARNDGLGANGEAGRWPRLIALCLPSSSSNGSGTLTENHNSTVRHWLRIIRVDASTKRTLQHSLSSSLAALAGTSPSSSKSESVSTGRKKDPAGNAAMHTLTIVQCHTHKRE